MKAKKARKSRPTAATKPTLAMITQYVVVSIAGLAGFTAYASGATMEGALARAVVVLLICTIIGYSLNIFLWLSAGEPNPSAASKQAAAAPSDAQVGTRLDLLAGEADERPANEAQAGSVASTAPR